jgi:hypothetical protein
LRPLNQIEENLVPVDVMDGARGVNYALDYRDVDGIRVPAKRRVYGYDDRKNEIPAPLLVAIDFGDIAFAERSSS